MYFTNYIFFHQRNATTFLLLLFPVYTSQLAQLPWLIRFPFCWDDLEPPSFLRNFAIATAGEFETGPVDKTVDSAVLCAYCSEHFRVKNLSKGRTISVYENMHKNFRFLHFCHICKSPLRFING